MDDDPLPIWLDLAFVGCILIALLAFIVGRSNIGGVYYMNSCPRSFSMEE